MPKGKVKSTSAEKGRKRKGEGKSDHEEREDQAGKVDLVEMPNDKRKQKKRTKTVKKLNFEGENVNSPQLKKKKVEN